VAHRTSAGTIGRIVDLDPLELAPSRPIVMQYMTGRALYERVIRDGVGGANVSVWIATANLKELMVEPPRGTRSHARGEYISVLEVFEGLASRGVELRILHAGLPSRAFARQLVQRRRLVSPRPGAHGKRRGPLELRRCPRVHFKAVVIDGAKVYLGSANWTGAGLGAKGGGRRNFEVGFVSEDELLLDDVQALFDRVWSGRACKGCKLREVCPSPLDSQENM
jgi:phosphatidylserine/phosphatidylglycerophosphate/cardiolipin synthase-like enzyme